MLNPAGKDLANRNEPGKLAAFMSSPARKICFVAAESEEEAFYTDRFDGHELVFCERLADVPPDTEVLSVFIGERLTGEFLQARPGIRLIATRSTGCDHIDLAACREGGVLVTHVAGYGENTVAEHTFALMLALSRRLRESTEAALSGNYTHEDLRGGDLRGRTLGVVGAGRVGLHVIRIALAFGMDVVAFDAHPQRLYTEILDFRYTSFDELLRRSDIITLHVPINESTFHLLNRETLGRCRPGVRIINTARGGLIDSRALLEALDSGQVAGAGLDVLEEESVFRGGAAQLGQQIADRVRSGKAEGDRIALPEGRRHEIARFLSSNALLRRPEVVFTPHNAYNSDEARAFINRLTAENIECWLDGEIPDRLCP
ncbi:MAG: NAD(P)-dependent oxidoreductase [Terrimicrobiaceae bacterium]|nr:NAD(P)-dependent oxidoreductase [Terrimicrobiaceae bacterium]